MERVHHHLTDTDSAQQTQRHLSLEHHLPHRLIVPKLTICHPDIIFSPDPLLSTQLFNLDGFAQDCLHNTVYNPDMLTDKGTSGG
jgi:hypothetical protein